MRVYFDLDDAPLTIVEVPRTFAMSLPPRPTPPPPPPPPPDDPPLDPGTNN